LGVSLKLVYRVPLLLAAYREPGPCPSMFMSAMNLNIQFYTHWRWWQHKVVWKNSSSALTLSFPPALVLCGLREKHAGGELSQSYLKLFSPGSISSVPRFPGLSQQSLTPSSEFSPHLLSAAPTHLGPQVGSQTGPCRSQGRRLRERSVHCSQPPPSISLAGSPSPESE
jgi:hypothetical protein